MGLKNYIFGSIIFIVIISGYLYTLLLGDYTLKLDIPMIKLVFEETLPIYIWITLPLVILFIASLLHMILASTKIFFAKRSRLSDIESIKEYIEFRVLNKKSEKKIKNVEFKQLALIINQIEITAGANEFDSDNKQLNASVQKIKKINNNEYVQIKSLKLDNNNDITKQNLLNRINHEDSFSLEVLSKSKLYDENIINLAFDKILKTQSTKKVKSLVTNIKLTSQMLVKLLLSNSKENAKLLLTNDEILEYIKTTKLTNKELITVAKNYKDSMQPEQLIKLFEDVVATDESLTQSYLYVLFEYQMVEKINEILVNSQKDEYTIFKALMDLKEAGKYYTLENLVLS